METTIHQHINQTMLHNITKTLSKAHRTSYISSFSSNANNFMAAQNALKEFGEAALLPTKNRNGLKGFRKPKISGRKASILRKQAKLQATYIEELPTDVDATTAIHFKPSWDKKGPVFLATRPDRVAALARRKLRRVAEIDQQLAKQDDIMKKHRKNIQDAKPKSFFDKLVAAKPS